MQRSTSKTPIIMDKNPVSTIAEAYRGLRTSIEFMNKENKMCIIGITSSQQGEGKTTTAANLAIAYAQANRRVLLIDANMRQPMVHDIFLKTNYKGLANIVSNVCELKEVVVETHIPNLDILPAGGTPPNPSELLSSVKFYEILDETKSQYDVIIVDSPPVLHVTDAQIIAAVCDGVLLVASGGKVKKHVIRRAKALLDNVKANVMGVVLNNIKSRNKRM